MSGIGAAAAAARYASTAASAPGEGASQGTQPAGDFGQMLTRAIAETVATAKEADRAAAAAVAGKANVTEVVTAIARAELALQTTVAIRDRVIQAYQDVMRMPI
jgi:flagellar hook-basal body complex protein FliE